MSMYIGPLFGPANAKFDQLKIRVIFVGGSEVFECNLLSIQDDNGLKLYRVARQDEKGTVLVLHAGFPSGGWFGFVNESGKDLPNATQIGFMPRDVREK